MIIQFLGVDERPQTYYYILYIVFLKEFQMIEYNSYSYILEIHQYF